MGKSTLVNALIGQHLSIVSPKEQTTRERVGGLLTTDDYQILFIDAPGLLDPRYPLQEAMRWAAEQALEDADVVLFLLDPTQGDTRPDEDVLRRIEDRSTPIVFAVNKTDLLATEDVDRILRELETTGHDALAISATRGSGLEELLQHLVPLLPESPPLYPPDETATRPVRFFAEEFVRESCMEELWEEVPYSIAVRVEEFREAQDPVYIRMTIYVERDSQKGIVIGRGGSTIKRIGARSRRKIEELIGRKAYLDLRVKVMPRWPRKPGRLAHLGFRLPPGRG